MVKPWLSFDECMNVWATSNVLKKKTFAIISMQRKDPSQIWLRTWLSCGCVQ